MTSLEEKFRLFRLQLGCLSTNQVNKKVYECDTKEMANGRWTTAVIAGALRSQQAWLLQLGSGASTFPEISTFSDSLVPCLIAVGT